MTYKLSDSQRTYYIEKVTQLADSNQEGIDPYVFKRVAMILAEDVVPEVAGMGDLIAPKSANPSPSRGLEDMGGVEWTRATSKPKLSERPLPAPNTRVRTGI